MGEKSAFYVFATIKKRQKNSASNSILPTSVKGQDPRDPHVLGLPDPDPLVRGTDLYPDPSLFS